MGNYAHSLPPSSLAGEDSKGNILPLCRGKRSFFSKVVFADAHNAGHSERSPPPCSGIIRAASIHSAQHAKQIEGNSPPGLHPDNAPSFMPKQTVGRRGERLSSGKQNRPSYPKKAWGLGRLPQVHTGRHFSLLNAYLQSYLQFDRFHLTESKVATAYLLQTGERKWNAISQELGEINALFAPKLSLGPESLLKRSCVPRIFLRRFCRDVSLPAPLVLCTTPASTHLGTQAGLLLAPFPLSCPAFLPGP